MLSSATAERHRPALPSDSASEECLSAAQDWMYPPDPLVDHDDIAELDLLDQQIDTVRWSSFRGIAAGAENPEP